MYTVFAALEGDYGRGKIERGGAELEELAQYLFGDAAYSLRHIREMVKLKRELPAAEGRRPHFPRDAESVLFRFIAKLRQSRILLCSGLLCSDADDRIASVQ